MTSVLTWIHPRTRYSGRGLLSCDAG